MVECLLSGITPLILGYRDGQKDDKSRLNDIITGMSAQGLDEAAGVERGVWFPDVEFDDSMEAPEKWPEPGTISGTPILPQTRQRNHQYTDGTTSRTDGQQMFEAGTTAPPPESATE
jgi:hypothetical protein